MRGIGPFLRLTLLFASLFALPLASYAETHRTVVLRVPPLYPEIARRMRLAGIVIVRATVQANGVVSETHVESGHPLLRAAAEDAVHHWRFAPDSGPSECVVSISFEYTHQ